LEVHGGAAVAHIDVEDIAACAYAVLTGAAPRGGIHDLTGPQALTPADLADALSIALNRPIGVVQPGLDDLVPILRGRGLPEAFTQEFATLARNIAAGSLSKVTSSVSELTGKPPPDSRNISRRTCGGAAPTGAVGPTCVTFHRPHATSRRIRRW
jgi:uncharacterized protein YbjT (DUF2867 family)